MKRLSGSLNKDGMGNVIHTCTGFLTKGFEKAVAQIGLIAGTPTDVLQTIGVVLNGLSIPWLILPTVAPVAQEDKVSGKSDGTGSDAILKINSTDIAFVIGPHNDAVAQQQTITGESDGTDQHVTVGVNSDNLDWHIAAEVSAVAQEDTITGASTDADQTVKVNINTTTIDWPIQGTVAAVAQVDRIHDNGMENLVPDIYINTIQVYNADPAGNMTTYYEGMLAAINAAAPPVTATYVDAGDHSLGVLVTADVAGTPFTIAIDGASTVHRDAVVANVVGYAFDMATEYEELFGLINASSEPVTATYINAGDHSQGITITADVPGTAFVCYLDDDSGTLDVTHAVANVVAIPLDMATAYTTLIGQINGIVGGDTTASFIDPLDHAAGIKLIADVAGVAFTVTLTNETNTLATATSVANVVADVNEVTKYEALLTAVNASAEPVTATYVNGGDHGDGIYLTADVAGTAFTSQLIGATGTIQVVNVVANVPAGALDMNDQYETLLADINAAQDKVVASFTDNGDHSAGLTLTAARAGYGFTLTFTAATGTVAYTEDTANKENYTNAIQFPLWFDAASEVEIVAPPGATAMIIRGEVDVMVDPSTGVDTDQCIYIIKDVYIQLPISEGDAFYVRSVEAGSVSICFLKI